MAEFIEAAQNGDIPTLKQYRGAGMDVNWHSKDGESALFVAASRGRDHVCLWLLENEASVDTPNRRTGETALHGAADRGQKDCAFLLLRRGANVNAKTNTNGDTPLHLASYRGHLEVCKILLNHDADIWLNNNQQQRAIDQAKQKGHTAIYQLLRKKEGSGKQHCFSDRAETAPIPRSGAEFHSVIGGRANTTEVPIIYRVLPVEQIPFNKPISSSEHSQPYSLTTHNGYHRPPHLINIESTDRFGHAYSRETNVESLRSIREPVESTDFTTDTLTASAVCHPPAWTNDSVQTGGIETGTGELTCAEPSVRGFPDGSIDQVDGWCPDTGTFSVTSHTTESRDATYSIETSLRPEIELSESENLAVISHTPIGQSFAQSENDSKSRCLKLMKKVEHLEKYGEALQITLTKKLDEIEGLMREKLETKGESEQRNHEIERLNHEVSRQSKKVREIETSLGQASRQLRAMTGNAQELRQALEVQIVKTENTMKELRGSTEKAGRLESLNGELQQEIKQLKKSRPGDRPSRTGGYALVARGLASPNEDKVKSATVKSGKMSATQEGAARLFTSLLPVFSSASNSALLNPLLISLKETVRASIREAEAPALDSVGTVWELGRDFQWVDKRVTVKSSRDGSVCFCVQIIHRSKRYEFAVFSNDELLDSGKKQLLPIRVRHKNILASRHHFTGSLTCVKHLCEDLKLQFPFPEQKSICVVTDPPSTTLKEFLFVYAKKTLLSEDFILMLLFEIFSGMLEISFRDDDVWTSSLEDIYLDSWLRVKLTGTSTASNQSKHKESMQSLAEMINMLIPINYGDSQSWSRLQTIMNGWKSGRVKLKELFIISGIFVFGPASQLVTSIEECRIWCQSTLMAMIVQEGEGKQCSYRYPVTLHPRHSATMKRKELEKEFLLKVTAEELFDGLKYLKR